MMHPRSLKGLSKAGDIILAGEEGFPSFSQARLLKHLPRILDDMYEDDREGFKALTYVFGLLPSVVIQMILAIAAHDKFFPGFIAALLRQIHVGVRGVVFTLYYSGIDGSGILPSLGYSTTIHSNLPQDTEMNDLLQKANPLTQPNTMMDRARNTWPALAKLSVKERLQIVTRLKHVILERQEEIVQVIQNETQKARTDILTSEIFPLMEHLVFLEKRAEKVLREETVPTSLAMMGKKSQMWFEPLGTVLVISPWNYPFYQAITPITCCFVTGNACIYKPSEVTPLQGLVESVLEEAGFRENWVQIAYGDGAVAQQLIAARPQKIFFTGSVGTGRKIMAQAAEFLIPVELELGGKDPMIVFKEANLARAVKGAAWGAFTNSGQSCTSVERLYVEESIYESFKGELLREVRSMKMAVDKDGNADMGAMISSKQVRVVAELVKDAVQKGAKMLTGETWDFQSNLIPPIVLEGTTHEMRINREEIFGPVLPLMKFSTETEAIQLANDSTFGLSASVWGEKTQVERVARQIVTGNVSINNVMVSEGNHDLPFGGVKDSGIGRYKGAMGLRAFCNVKSVMIDANSKKIEANWYPYTAKKYGFFTGLTQALFKGKLIGFALNGLKLESYSQKARRD